MPRRRTHKTEGGGGSLRAVATLINKAKLKVGEEEDKHIYVYVCMCVSGLADLNHVDFNH